MIDQKEIGKKVSSNDSVQRAELRVVSDRVSESFCSVLKKAREKKGLTQKDIADSLRVPLTTIVALEEQRYEKLPEDTYIKGYIRSYAGIVGLNPEGLIKDFQQDKGFRELSENDRLVAEEFLKQQSLNKADPVLDQKLQEFIIKLHNYKQYTPAVFFALLVIMISGVIFLLNFKDEKAIEVPSMIENVKILSADGLVVVSNIMDSSVITSVINQQTSLAKADHIKMMFSGTTWVTIRDASKELIHQSRKQKGEELDLEVVEQGPYFIKLSNASAVNLYYKDKAVDFSAYISNDDQLHEFTLNP
jgi:cytoskeleton protein RodZ